MRTLSAQLDEWLATIGTIEPVLNALVTWNDPEGSPPTSTVLGFTSWYRDFPYDAGDGEVTYVAGLGMSVSRIQGNSEGAVDSLEVKLLLNGAIVTETDLMVGRWHGATIQLFLLNPLDHTQGHLVFHQGTLGQTTIDRGQATAEFLGIMQRYLSTIGETVTATCQNVFCGPIDARGRGCGLDEADYTHAGTVTVYDEEATIGGQAAIIVYSDDLNAIADDTFNDGRIKFDAQPWITFGIRLSRMASGALVLKQQPPFAITAGMTFVVVEGCAKTLEACKAHNNVPRMRAFPYLKGNDKLFQSGKR